MTLAVERIVVQTTLEDKKSIAAKAKKLSLPISELMRRGAFAYDAASSDGELEALADTARSSAERAGTAIDDALAFIEASNGRIDRLERKAAMGRKVAVRRKAA